MSRRVDSRLGVCAMAVLMALAEPVLAQPAAPAATARVRVTEFKVSGNTLLPDASIEAALAPFKGDRSLDELKQAAAAVQALYGRAGFGAVVAFLPAQAPKDGVVAISVVEGRLSRVTVAGNKRFSESNIRASVPALSTGETPRLRRIDAQIQMANENPAKQIEVLLQPGDQLGEVGARINVTEQSLQRWSLGLDNTGNSRTGRLRANLGWQHANVSGHDDIVSAQFQTAPDKPSAVKVFSAAYRLPIYSLLTVIDAYAAYSDVDGGNTATIAGNLQFSGRGRVFGTRATHYLPRLGELDQRVALALDQRAYLNNCRIEGLPDGACGSAGESVTVTPLGLEYTLQKSGPIAFGAGVSIQHNLQIGGGKAGSSHFEAVRPGAKPHYTALKLQGSGAIGIADDWQLRMRAALQYTRDALVPGEQFGIGGLASVRGYEERELSGDRGMTAAIDLVGPDLAKSVGLKTGGLRLLGFTDGGWVQNRLGTPCLVGSDHCSIGSVGIGARFDLGSLQARLYIANAMKAAARTDRHETRAHFALNYSF